MNKIEAGTKIVITTPWATESAYKTGDIFTVTSFSPPGVYVTVGDDERFYIASDEFEDYTEPEAAPHRSVAFEDIQEGDLIKAEYTEDGVKHTVEGVAGYHYDNTGNWVTSRSGGYVAYKDWEATYTLLERPEPPKPNPFAEANVGSLALESDGYVWLKTADNKWQFIRKFDVRTGELSDLVRDDTHLNDGSFQITYNA